MATRKKDEHQTVAEAELEATRGGADPTSALEERAKDERALLEEERKAGRKADAPSSSDLGDTPAEQHATDHVASATRGGDRPDQLSITNPHEEVAYGHFCTVVDGDLEGRFGVYEDTVSVGDDGKPEYVRFRSRDADNLVATVRYDALRPAETRGNAPR